MGKMSLKIVGLCEIYGMLQNSQRKTFVFDYVEIDFPFYRTPSKQMVKNWAMKTPKNFKFTAKFPKVITMRRG